MAAEGVFEHIEFGTQQRNFRTDIIAERLTRKDSKVGNLVPACRFGHQKALYAIGQGSGRDRKADRPRAR